MLRARGRAAVPNETFAFVCLTHRRTSGAGAEHHQSAEPEDGQKGVDGGADRGIGADSHGLAGGKGAFS